MQAAAEVVPGMGILGIILDGFFQQLFRVVKALQVEQGDPAIDGRDFERGVGRSRVFERLQGFCKKLLVHVGNAQVIEAGRFLRIWSGTGCAEQRENEQRENKKKNESDYERPGH